MPAKRKTASTDPGAKKPGFQKRAPDASPGAEFSEKSFWQVARKSFAAIGETTLKRAFTLYHTFKDERTPNTSKMVIAGALAYLILPTDVIPDFIPFAGFTDDAGALAAAALAVVKSIRPEHKREAARQAKEFFL